MSISEILSQFDLSDEAGRGAAADALQEAAGVETPECRFLRESSVTLGWHLDTLVRFECRDECGTEDEIDASTIAEALKEAEEIVRNGGVWDEPSVVEFAVRAFDCDGNEVDCEWGEIEIPTDHEALIREAMGDAGCGLDPADHDWTSDGEGGCDQNPGVWSTGGTSMTFASHCRTCGLHRTEHVTGAQRNPGETDTVKYRALDEDEILRHCEDGDMDWPDDFPCPDGHLDLEFHTPGRNQGQIVTVSYAGFSHGGDCYAVMRCFDASDRSTGFQVAELDPDDGDEGDYWQSEPTPAGWSGWRDLTVGEAKSLGIWED